MVDLHIKTNELGQGDDKKSYLWDKRLYTRILHQHKRHGVCAWTETSRFISNIIALFKWCDTIKTDSF